MVNSYAAGLVDGEGTITLAKHCQSRFRYPLVSVSSTSYELVAFMRNAFGGSISTKRKCAKPTHRKSYSWQIQRRKALSVIKRILPYLQEVEKIRRARVLLSDYKRLTPRNGWYTPQMIGAKRAFEKRFFAERKYARQRYAFVVSDAGGSTPPRPPEGLKL